MNTLPCRLRSSRSTATSVPQLELDKVAVQLNIARYQAHLTQCSDLQALINEQPVPVDDNVFEEGERYQIEGRMAFDTFKTLTRPHATFGLEGCGRPWKLAERDMPELAKFLELVAQVRGDV